MSYTKKLTLTNLGEELLNTANKAFNQTEDYNQLTPNHKLVCDMGMYVDGCYTENKFDTVKSFAYTIAELEYQNASVGVVEIERKINRAIKRGLVIVK